MRDSGECECILVLATYFEDRRALNVLFLFRTACQYNHRCSRPQQQSEGAIPADLYDIPICLTCLLTLVSASSTVRFY